MEYQIVLNVLNIPVIYNIDVISNYTHSHTRIDWIWCKNSEIPIIYHTPYILFVTLPLRWYFWTDKKNDGKKLK